MRKEIIFEETQRFTQWWIWVLLLSLDVIFLFGVVEQVGFGISFGNQPMNNAGLLTLTIIILLLSLLILNAHLDTKISDAGIFVRFYPFQLHFKHFPWQTLSKIYVRKYAPMKEYGGWGIRFGIFGRGRAYNVSGNRGLQLEFHQNKSLLIGTQKPQQLKEVLLKIEKITHHK